MSINNKQIMHILMHKGKLCFMESEGGRIVGIVVFYSGF